MQEKFGKWGNKIHSELTRETVREFAAELKEVDGNEIWADASFRSTVSILRVSTKKAQRILLSLYSYQQNDLNRQNVGRLSVEHILPESPSWLSPEGWPSFDSDSHALCYNKLGNLTLLSPADNKGGEEQNGSFEKKVPFLQRSIFKENQEIAKAQEWTPNSVQARQDRLAKLACQTWPLANQ